jgi:hypothetical protein
VTVVAVTPGVAQATGKRGGKSAATSAIKKKKQKSQSLIDESAISALGSSAASVKQRMEETMRHHKELENIEKEKMKQSEKQYEWKNKTEEHEYKMKLVTDFAEMKKKVSRTKKSCDCFQQCKQSRQRTHPMTTMSKHMKRKENE